MTEHQCFFSEVKILKGDDDALKPGMRVLVPCECGELPLDAFGVAVMEAAEAETALALTLVNADMPLYHWAPTRRRKQIIRRGLLPKSRPTTHVNELGVGLRAPYVCFADTPSMAWALSGQQRSAPVGSWDLWQTWATRLTDPYALPSRSSDTRGIHEVRTIHRVFKRHLWLVGTRQKHPRKGNTT